MRPIRLALFSSRCKTCHISRINCVCRTKTVTNCSYVNKQIHLTLLSIDIEIPQTSFDRHILGYRQAGCLQLSHRLLPEMCGLRTRPRTDVDPPRRLPPSNCHRRGAYRLAASRAIPCWLLCRIAALRAQCWTRPIATDVARSAISVSNTRCVVQKRPYRSWACLQGGRLALARGTIYFMGPRFPTGRDRATRGCLPNTFEDCFVFR